MTNGDQRGGQLQGVGGGERMQAHQPLGVRFQTIQRFRTAIADHQARRTRGQVLNCRIQALTPVSQFRCQISKNAAIQDLTQKVAALEREWIDAGQKGDASWFERHLAATFVNTDESGTVSDKAAMIKEVRSREAKLESVSYAALDTKAYGDTVIATGITVRKGTLKGSDISGRFAWTDTWVKLGGEWQCVAGHASTVSAK